MALEFGSLEIRLLQFLIFLEVFSDMVTVLSWNVETVGMKLFMRLWYKNLSGYVHVLLLGILIDALMVKASSSSVI